MEAIKWIMRYLRGTSNLKLTFGSGKPVLVGYTVLDMARDVDNRKATRLLDDILRRCCALAIKTT